MLAPIIAGVTTFLVVYVAASVWNRWSRRRSRPVAQQAPPLIATSSDTLEFLLSGRPDPIVRAAPNADTLLADQTFDELIEHLADNTATVRRVKPLKVTMPPPGQRKFDARKTVRVDPDLIEQLLSASR